MTTEELRQLRPPVTHILRSLNTNTVKLASRHISISILEWFSTLHGLWKSNQLRSTRLSVIVVICAISTTEATESQVGTRNSKL